jgi:hypothetical protein
MNVESIAGFASVIFSVLISASITGSLKADRNIPGQGKWLTLLFIVGSAGVLLYPVVMTISWNVLSLKARCIVGTIDFLTILSVTTLYGYYFSYLKNRVWTIENIWRYLPPDKSLISEE